MGHVAAPTDLRFEHRTDGGPVLGIGTATPRLSWIIPAADAGFVQDAYEVELVRGSGASEVVRVASGEQVLVPWPADPLTSRESVRVRVRVCGAGRWSAWSDPATVEAGLLRTGDWTARFISPCDWASWAHRRRCCGRLSTCLVGWSRRGCTPPPTACMRPP